MIPTIQVALLQCTNSNCKNEWYYKGKKERACCPKCFRKIRVATNFKKPRKNAIYILTDSDGKKHKFSALRPHYYKNGELRRFQHKTGA